jgi:uncharacterized membrane protein HdeD (DUF308 family)
LCQAIRDEWLLAVSGMTSIGFGGLLVLCSTRAAPALILWLGAYTLLLGALLVGLGRRLHSWSASQAHSSSVGSVRSVRMPARSVKPT